MDSYNITDEITEISQPFLEQIADLAKQYNFEQEVQKQHEDAICLNMSENIHVGTEKAETTDTAENFMELFERKQSHEKDFYSDESPHLSLDIEPNSECSITKEDNDTFDDSKEAFNAIYKSSEAVEEHALKEEFQMDSTSYHSINEYDEIDNKFRMEHDHLDVEWEEKLCKEDEDDFENEIKDHM